MQKTNSHSEENAMRNINFVAIDFETANYQRASICEAGICVVRYGKIAETKSWLVHPQYNYYSYWNIKIHGICPEDTIDAPDFPKIWYQIEPYLKESPILVAHNAAFDMGCLRCTFDLYGMEKPELTYFCSLRAARHIYDFNCNTLAYLCTHFEIQQGTHHQAGDDAEMCARLFIREIKDAGFVCLDEMDYCNGIL